MLDFVVGKSRQGFKFLFFTDIGAMLAPNGVHQSASEGLPYS
jgi:hypothetical protein